jgi:hypothetical protein
MKINDIIIKEAHETGDGNRKLAAIGRVLMDKAVTQKDDGLSNVMATLGDNLTRYNTTFGPRSPAELMKKSNITSKELMMKLLKFGEAELAKGGDVAKGSDVADEPEDDEKYSASDDEIDAKAQAMAKG